MFRDYTQYKILSWEELLLLVDSIIINQRLLAFAPQPIRPISQDAIIPAAMLASKIGVTVNMTEGITFDITNTYSPSICLFKIEGGFDHQTDTTKIYVDILYHDQHLILPWKSK